MKRFFGRCVMPLLLCLMWLLLNGTLSAGYIALGLALSIAVTWAATTLRPLQAHPKKIVVMARLFWVAVVDIAQSNLVVARRIWQGPRVNAPAGFVNIPLTLRDPHGLAALACIVTYTPGTVWVDFSEHDMILTLHVLELESESHWINLIQQRYELPLKEIFE